MNTSIFIGLILLGFGLLVFSIKLMAYNRKKYNFSDSHVGSSSLYLKDFSKNFIPNGAENSAKIASEILEEKR